MMKVDPTKTVETMDMPLEDIESIAGSHDGFEDDDKMTDAGTSVGDASESEEKIQFAKRETKAVFRLRLLVFLVLFLAAVTVCVIVYLITAHGEEDDFKSQYESASQKITATFLDIATNKFGAVSSLGVGSVEGQDQEWPYVTYANFHQRAATARKQSGSIYINLHPLVTDAQRADWEAYSAGNESKWVYEGLQYQENVDMFAFAEEGIRERLGGFFGGGGHGTMPIYVIGGPRGFMPAPTSPTYLPTWQSSPVIFGGIRVNQDEIQNQWEDVDTGAVDALETQSVNVGMFHYALPGNITSTSIATVMFALLMSVQTGNFEEYLGDPMSKVFFPIFDSLREDRMPVAVMVAWVHWKSYFRDILPSSMNGVLVVLSNTCSGNFTYEINGPQVMPLGEGDLHDPEYDSFRRSASFASVDSVADGTKYGIPLSSDHCVISMDVYPSSEFEQSFQSSTPIYLTIAVACIFIFTAFMFILYDTLVERRQALVLMKAEQSTAIVTSLFPEQVRDRLMEQQPSSGGSGNKSSSFSLAPTRRLKGYLEGNQEDDVDMAPIADLFPHCTVLFADISGFTAWSSTRDPAQVFILLQTVYQAFDRVAKRRKVFKVETIGDSYVAVTGLPEPQLGHAVIMARFAQECRCKMNELMPRLESRLGPDTAELAMRFGLHSGPVTAGVLRGDRARFQLFGDTVNTAARMESTGKRNMIQVSQATHDLLVQAGKSRWITARTDSVNAKGKGVLAAYWVNPTGITKNGSVGSFADMSNNMSDLGSNALDASLIRKRKPRSDPKRESKMKQARLVNWIVEILKEHLKKLVASRGPTEEGAPVRYTRQQGKTSLDEVAEVIKLPRFDAIGKAEKDIRFINLSPEVVSQLHQYVTALADMYLPNPFHNFEHAAHVTMATDKFLKRIAGADVGAEDEDEIAAKMHDYTHGINSDPLTLCAIVVSALIHDTDHPGVGNARLAEENKGMADKYRGKSIAEQNSLDLAWDLLMSKDFQDLRRCLFTTQSEMSRFRQVLVNVVLATDIFDKELNDLRKKRWEKAFSDESISHEENNDLRATIVIEHIIQASDVSHTMQHWHIYRKWNRRLFQELSLAFRQGRMGKDPAEFWYNGEIGFFDNYIIPLAKKLKDCRVFGVSSDECLNYAMQNREEWKERGQEIVAEMVEELRTEQDASEGGIDVFDDSVRQDEDPASIEC